jgi:hypothetical protein
MSDEIEKAELVNAEQQKQLDEKSLDEVVGAVAATTTRMRQRLIGNQISQVAIRIRKDI